MPLQRSTTGMSTERVGCGLESTAGNEAAADAVSVAGRGDTGMSSRDYLLAGAVGGLAMLGANVPTLLFYNFLQALLGPASFFISGLFNEVVYYSLVVALISTVPRRGAVTVMIMTRLVLAGVAFGQLSLIELAEALAAAGLMETSLVFGRWHDERRRLETITFCLLAAGDALLTWGEFAVGQLLYRIHYDHWFIAANVVINGFFYTLAGCYAGRRLVRPLKGLAI